MNPRAAFENGETWSDPIWSLVDGSLTAECAARRFASAYWPKARKVTAVAYCGDLCALFKVKDGIRSYKVSPEDGAWVVRYAV